MTRARHLCSQPLTVIPFWSFPSGWGSRHNEINKRKCKKVTGYNINNNKIYMRKILNYMTIAQSCNTFFKEYKDIMKYALLLICNDKYEIILWKITKAMRRNVNVPSIDIWVGNPFLSNVVTWVCVNAVNQTAIQGISILQCSTIGFTYIQCALSLSGQFYFPSHERFVHFGFDVPVLNIYINRNGFIYMYIYKPTPWKRNLLTAVLLVVPGMHAVFISIISVCHF